MARQNQSGRLIAASARQLRSAAATCAIAGVFLISTPVAAEDLLRVWVDWSGQHTIEATLVQVQSNKIVLMTTDGRRITLPVDKLSEKDQAYVKEFRSSNVNILRAQPPKPPNVKPLPLLDLPPAQGTAEKNSIIEISSAHTVSQATKLPAAIPADPAPAEIAIAEQRFVLPRIDAHDICSDLIPVGDAGSPALGLSISVGLTNPQAQAPVHRLLRLDAHNSETEVIYRSPDRIRLFDHHVPSRRSLVMVGHNSLGQNGKLALANGWNRGGMLIRFHRAFPGGEVLGQFPQVRWARLIDDEHFVAIVDRTLVAANIVSGKVLYRIEEIHGNSVPALSGGRRFLAVPYEGGVQLYRSQDGGALGRIGTESSIVPAVSFSNEGDSLAIVNSRRMRVWSLPGAALRTDIETRTNLGSGPPTWVDSDLVMSSSGSLISIFRGVPVWRYDIAGTVTNYVGGNVAMLRKQPHAGLHVLKLPHRGANEAMRWIDAIPTATPAETWKMPGRSVWSHDGWADRDVRISARGSDLR